MATIIIPAHNEETVIRACIDSVIDQKDVETIIVACNGCSDNTADIVREHYPEAICLDIEKPSKTNALNEADQHITSYPVFYLDADTRISENAVAFISAHVEKNDILLSAPTPNIDLTQSSWPVRQYYKTWLELPYIKDGVIGTCSFILSKKGRKRFKKFPDIINDDGYVRCCFESQERANIAGTTIHITAPKNLYSLIKIKTRARLGNMQLDALNLCAKPKKAKYGVSFKNKLLSKDAIPTFVYMLIALFIRFRAKKQFKAIENYRWEKDHTSR
ncbi:MAG: Glycosyl transferase family 2 [uncultured Thiotrichaceae bacterium]|uniref:Glycosyl transferase family 2 n=1 Tax=uncultured Thiotrichaceae bacterium TaxID=298394 RepID=A0A6S6TJN6_9GAMM|nr:MAG: Glycosyl transferase family 2 [uncultured Thiotrichaceae bacterium]